MPSWVRAAAFTVTAALVLTACGEGQDDGAPFKACMVTDTGGIDDESVNDAVWRGMNAAGAPVEPSYAASLSVADYTARLTAQVEAGCGVVIAVGESMTEAVATVAEANPERHFAIVDGSVDLGNVYSIRFDLAQPAFLAGYLAAGMTATGTVATFGGIDVPQVAGAMDGYAEGVEYHNAKKNTDVAVLGWDDGAGSGTFVNSVTDQAQARFITENLTAAGADVVMPVAGDASLGAAAYAEEAGPGGPDLIWSDVDGCESAARYCGHFLTSVVKEIPAIVAQTVTAAANGNPSTGGYVGTLGNDGVGIAPFHDFQDDVPAELQGEIERLKEGIVDGKVPLTSGVPPS